MFNYNWIFEQWGLFNIAGMNPHNVLILHLFVGASLCQKYDRKQFEEGTFNLKNEKTNDNLDNLDIPLDNALDKPKDGMKNVIANADPGEGHKQFNKTMSARYITDPRPPGQCYLRSTDRWAWPGNSAMAWVNKDQIRLPQEHAER